jgi:hypothetical protein
MPLNYIVALFLWSLSMLNTGAGLYGWDDLTIEEKRGSVTLSALLAVGSVVTWLI